MTRAQMNEDSAAFKMDAMLEQLKTVLGEETQPVTCRWLSYENAVPASVARKALETCAEQSKGKVVITYLLSGTAKDGGQQTVRLVKGSDLAPAKELLVGGGTHQIYALSPGTPAPDPLGIHVQDREQAKRLMSALLTGKSEPSVNAYGSNACSMVRGIACVRRLKVPPQGPLGRAPAVDAKPSGARSAPARPAQTAAARIMMSGRAGSASDQDPVRPVGDGQMQRSSVPLEKKTSPPSPVRPGTMARAFAKAPPKQAKPEPEASSEPAAKSERAAQAEPPSMAKPKVKAEAKTKAKANPKAKAPVPAQPASKENEAPDSPGAGAASAAAAQALHDDDSDDMDASPLPTRRAPARRQQVLQDDDSDDDSKMDAHPAEAAPGASAAAGAAAVQVPSKRAHEQAKAELAVSAPSAKKSRPDDAAAGKLETDPEAPQSTVQAHPEYGVPPDADAEIQMIGGKPFWAFINDKGEEVTVLAKAVKAPCQPMPDKPPKDEVKVKKQEDDADKTSPVKPKAKGGKKAAKMAGVRDIRSLFGKK